MRVILIALVSVTMLTAALLPGCTPSQPPHLAVYRSHVDSKNPTRMIMDAEPLFTDADIREYRWKTQTILFTEEFLKRKAAENPVKPEDYRLRNGGSWLLKTVQSDRFTLMTDGKPIYAGTFEQSIVSSYCPPGPFIRDVSDGVSILYMNGTPALGPTVMLDPLTGDGPQNVKIEVTSDSKDPRYNPLIQNALKKEQLQP